LSIAKHPPSAYKPPCPADEVGRKRHQYLYQVQPKAPSTTGQPKEFANQQKNSTTAIACGRPRGTADTIPVTLLHPIFGRFLDDIDTHEPTTEDNAFAHELSTIMADFHAREEVRGFALLKVLQKWGISLVQTTIDGTQYRTDGDLQHNQHRYMIAELKNEVGSGTAEPYCQAAAYYLESTQKLAPDFPKSPLPCLLLYIFGMNLNEYCDALTITRSQDHTLALEAQLGFIDPTYKCSRPFCLSTSTHRTHECNVPLLGISVP
jgi:hypothetical protein